MDISILCALNTIEITTRNILTFLCMAESHKMGLITDEEYRESIQKFSKLLKSVYEHKEAIL